jgi:hypothetical protein
MRFQQALIALSLTLTGAQAQCVGPDINAAAINLIKSFESWQPNICKLQEIQSMFLCSEQR